MHLETLFIVFVLSLAYGQDRRIVSKLNPGCTSNDTRTTLVYIKADGSNDTIHQIWDFTRGIPTVIYAIGSLTSTLTISWVETEPVRFTLSEEPVYSFATAIDKLYEYDDIHDHGRIDNASARRTLWLMYVAWDRFDSVLTDKEARLNMRGLYVDNWSTGIIDIKLDLLPFKDYAVDLPHLIHTANSTLVDISLVNFTTFYRYNSSRFAANFVLTSTDRWEYSMNYIMRKSLDDEHTPGVFEIVEITTPRSTSSDAGGFMQFRPVAYTEAERSVSSSTNAYVSELNRIYLPEKSTINTFYKGFDEKLLLVQETMISFGLPGDGYYKQHNFTSWSFTFGYGAPPVESVSLFVIIIIAIGLGVPVLLAASGVTYVLVRKYKQRNQPARFIDEE